MKFKNGLDRGIRRGKIAAGLRCRYNSLYTRPVNPDRLRADPFEAFSCYSLLIARVFFPINAKRPPLGGREHSILGHYRFELFAFGGLAHDPESILAAVYGLALMGFKLSLDIIFELCVAPLTDAQNGYAFFSLYDPELALLHDFSLAHSAGRT
jgi:hypothetical protein